MIPLAPLVTAFFRQHLAGEKGVSKHTLTSYSYTFKFLVDTSAVGSGSLLPSSPSRISTRPWSGTSWSIGNDTAGTRHGHETSA